MSSQGANSSDTFGVVGYSFNRNSMRDSSDVTRAIRERIAYSENQSVVPVAEYTKDRWIKYGNGFRLSYLFGKYKCDACSGNTFGINGVGS